MERGAGGARCPTLLLARAEASLPSRKGGGVGLGSIKPRKCFRYYCPVVVEASHWTKMQESDCNIVYDIVYDTIYDIVYDIIATYSKLDELGFLS